MQELLTDRQIKEKALRIGSFNKRTFKTLESIDAETKPLIDRISQKGYVMNDNDNREMKME
jgi:hypothetical protein